MVPVDETVTFEGEEDWLVSVSQIFENIKAHSHRRVTGCVQSVQRHVFGWLAWVNAELSQKKLCQGLKSQRGGGRGRLYLTLHCKNRMTPALR